MDQYICSYCSHVYACCDSLAKINVDVLSKIDRTVRSIPVRDVKHLSTRNIKTTYKVQSVYMDNSTS